MLFSTKTYGLSLTTDGLLESTAGCVQLSLEKNQVNIIECSQSPLSEVITDLKKETVSCCLSSSSIIAFESDKTDISEALNSFLPGVNPETFFIQKVENYFAIINQTELNAFLELKREQGLKITQVILEPVALFALQRATNETEIAGENFRLIKNSIVKVDSNGSNHSLRIDNHNLRTSEYLAFGSSIAHQVIELEQINLPETLKSISKTLSEEKQFKTILSACIGLLLVLSLGNYMYFSSLTAKNQELDLALYSSNASQEKLESLKQKVEEYQQLRSGLNEVKDQQGAYLLDLIGQSVPKEIIFKSINLEAPDKIKEGYQIKFNENLLTIEGKTTSTMALNKWIDKVSKSGWVDDVELMSYEDNKENRGNFKLQMFLDNV